MAKNFGGGGKKQFFKKPHGGASKPKKQQAGPKKKAPTIKNQIRDLERLLKLGPVRTAL